MIMPRTPEAMEPNMTDRYINGVLVLKDEPTLSPLPSPRRNGEPIFWDKIRTLTLEDGSTIYGCHVCDYTSVKVLSVRPHLNAHRTPKSKPPPHDLPEVAQIVARLGRLPLLESQVEEWRRRALDAEGELRKIRAAFGRVLN